MFNFIFCLEKIAALQRGKSGQTDSCFTQKAFLIGGLRVLCCFIIKPEKINFYKPEKIIEKYFFIFYRLEKLPPCGTF